jgi:hypothetical protein
LGDEKGARVTLTVIATAGWLLVAGCGCGGSERAATTSAERTRGHSAWSAAFDLPEGWSGGENDAGGYEFTNGELALMLGRAPAATSASLDAFFEERTRVLEAQGKLETTERGAEPVAGKPARRLSSLVSTPEGGALAVRLLVVEPNPSERLSFLMVGDKAHATALGQSWNFVVGSLRFE